MFTLPALPYGYDALAPAMSDKTLHHHHDKHHAKYVDTLNGLLKDKPDLASEPMEAVVVHARAEKEQKMFNQAAQAWNHAFFWECMGPNGGQPAGDLAAAIDAAFGSLDDFKTSFVREGVGHFASGWVWLVVEGGALSVISTHDADTAAGRDGMTPLLVADLWEHAYYLDYQQDREGFLKTWFDKIVNWDFVAAQFAAAQGSGESYRYPTPETAKAA